MSRPPAPFHTVASSKMDYLTLIEHDVHPPIAFKSKAHLDAWVKSYDLICEPLGRRNAAKDVVLIHGKITPPFFDGGLFYGQIWVSINYRQYRNAIRFHVRNTEGNDKNIGIYDADHAVGRKRLQEIWPDAWVNLMLANSGINRSIGTMMEKIPLRILENQTEIHLNTESILKLLFKKTTKLSKEKISEYFSEAANSFIQEIDTSSNESAIYSFLMRENANNILYEIAKENSLLIKIEFPTKALIITSDTPPSAA
ncbi:hypothetical protein [Achromobacter aloeverae]|uniref:hypothetical protein n=1 Tax=Achromobacter aloeverae TaxID=1750518 RepID=UPI00100ECAFB|nr:hypothetical protein [Achromobacter aloeverae]